jgi:eukaryotic-like serine/threonine-protein kinase
MMSDSVDDLILTPRARFLKEQAARYEEAWELTLRGGKPPSIEAFLGSVDEPERTRITRELQRIERTYRVRLSFGKAETLGSAVGTPERDARPIETILMIPEPLANPANSTPENDRSPEQAQNEPLPETGPAAPAPADSSHPTLWLPGTFPEPSIEENVLDSSNPDASIHLPLLDSWGNDIEAPPIAGTLRSIIGPRPYLKGYEIIGELGRGGMGIVYKANQQGLNRLVAIKMVLGGEHAREEDLVRFKIEAEAVASIQHPNIVQIYEVGEKDGTPYFSLEFIDGGTLHQKIDGKPLPHDHAATIAHQLALAMEHFHQRGVIHRDLKPANVLMTLQGSPKITDFGLAKRLEGNSSQTRTGSLMGTPSYMAPEQASGDTRAISPLSDLYSLGAVLYEMLTGRPPFQGATMLDTIDQVRSQEPVPPRRLQPKIPRDLETICLKCLQKEPLKRYSGATALAEDLGHFLEGEPIKARPIGRFELGWRWYKRNPRIALLSSAVFLFSLILVVMAIVAAGRMAREAQTIKDARQLADDRFERGKKAIESGDVRQAIEIVGLPDPFVERTPALSEVRDNLRKLRAQVKTFAEFRRLLDLARYEGFLVSEKKLARAKDYFRELFALYDEIESHKGRGEFGLPPLSPWQLKLFREDVFDTFLVAALVEYDQKSQGKNPESAREAARLAVIWLDRAEKLIPPTRALYSRRIFFKQVIGDQAGAEADKKRAESIEPNSPVDLYWRGYSDRLRAEGSKIDNPRMVEEFTRQARDNFARNLKARPEHFWGHFEWATCHYDLKQWYDAIVGFTECIELNPDLPWPYHNRAEALANIQDFNEAILDETEAIKRDPEYLDAYLGRFTAYRALGKIPEAIADLDELIRLASSKGELIFQRGSLHFATKNYEKALADFDASVKEFPRAPLAYRNRAWTRFFLRDFEGAISDWSIVASLSPKDYQARHYIGVLNLGYRRYDEAIRSLDEALAIQPGYPLSSLARARIYHWRGDDTAALKNINDVVDRLDSAKWEVADKAAYLNDRVDLYRNLGRLDESEADAHRSIEINPKQVDAYLSLALLEKKRGKLLAEVQAWYDAMLKANPVSPDVHRLRAEFFRDLGRWDEALVEAHKARALDKERGPALARLICEGVVAARGDFDKATSEAEAILVKVERPDGPILYAAACLWSLASKSAAKSGDETRARVLADRAAAFLKSALGEGFHDFNYQEEERMILDPALEPIANRPDVQKLLSFLP